MTVFLEPYRVGKNSALFSISKKLYLMSQPVALLSSSPFKFCELIVRIIHHPV